MQDQRGRERETDRGSKDVSPKFADRATTRAAGVAGHISKCGKNVTQTSLAGIVVSVIRLVEPSHNLVVLYILGYILYISDTYTM